MTLILTFIIIGISSAWLARLLLVHHQDYIGIWNRAKHSYIILLHRSLLNNQESSHKIVAIQKLQVTTLVIWLLLIIIEPKVALNPFVALSFLFVAALPLLTSYQRQRRRMRAIENALPDFLDILSLTIEGGLDIIMALDEIIRTNVQADLASELRLLMNSIHLGTSRVKAFKELARRINLEACDLWIAAVEQSETLGTSLSETLAIQAQSARTLLFQKAERRAQRAPVKMMLPLIGLIFPVLFILIFGPLLLNFMIY